MRELGELIDLSDALDRRIGTYSGGMKRRLDLAAALVHDPQILFLDEPTTGLDPVSRVRVWDEVRRLNDELGMTIFLTTQYLEEADELAGRVGIIDHGRIVAEGTPQELKRSIGTDVIVARLDGDAKSVGGTVEHVPGVLGVEAHGDELRVSTANGPATISPVAVALSDCGVPIRDLTLRTPTLDDVFLELTGTRFQHDDEQEVSVMTTVTTIRPEPRHLDGREQRPDPRPAGFVSDVVTIAGRALRAIPRDVESVVPPVFIALFFFLVNVGTLQQLTERSIQGFDFKRVPAADGHPVGRHRRVARACSRLDVQDGYFDRLLLTPVRRVAILLGHLTADVTVAAALRCRSSSSGSSWACGSSRAPLGIVAFIAIAALWSLAFSGLRLRDRLEDRQPRGGATRRSCCSSRSCSSRRRTCRAVSCPDGSMWSRAGIR